MTRQAPVLVAIDDEPGMLTLVERATRSLGFEYHAFTNGTEALENLAQRKPDVVLVDLRMPQMNGLEVLRAIRERSPSTQVILMTAHASVETAIEAVKLGALDYLSKPFEIERLRQLLSGAIETLDRRAALMEAENATARRLELCGMIGPSALMQQLFDLVRRVAPHARAVLVTGETGTGKEGIARAIHDLGPRRSKRYLTINCSAVVETLFESELFGHMRGAFTGASENKAGLFEAADGGTLFLDEIGELPLKMQAKLLRVLETGEVQRVGALQGKKVDVRVVAATNRDLAKEADAGRFRRDLFFRLNLVELTVPPLRERTGDIPYLTAAFVREFAHRFNKPLEGVSPSAEQFLVTCRWPGNVRELRNALERACMLAEGRILTERDLNPVGGSRRTSLDSQLHCTTGEECTSLDADLKTREREHLLRALAATNGNKKAAAAALGLSRRTF